MTPTAKKPSPSATKRKRLKKSQIEILVEGLRATIAEIDTNLAKILASCREHGVSQEVIDAAQMGLRSRRAHHWDVLSMLEKAQGVTVTWERDLD